MFRTKTKIKKNKVIQQLPVILQADKNGGYWAQCPTLIGCYSQGETIEETLENIREAAQLCLEEEKTTAPLSATSFHLITV